MVGPTEISLNRASVSDVSDLDCAGLEEKVQVQNTDWNSIIDIKC